MRLADIQPGDIVYANTTITNDGSLPDYPEAAVLAITGARGVLVNTGHLEDNPAKELFLVRFEDQDQNLGPAIACWAEELKVTSD